jgi:hypothetical protein
LRGGMFRAQGIEKMKRKVGILLVPLFLVVIFVLTIVDGVDPVFYSTYPISLMDGYGWLVVAISFVALVAWEQSEFIRDWMSLGQYEISFEDRRDEVKDGITGKLVVHYARPSNVDKTGSKHYKEINVREVLPIPRKPLYRQPSIGYGGFPVKGTASSLKIVSENSHRDLLLGFSNVDQMKDAFRDLTGKEMSGASFGLQRKLKRK